jgi:hypothetical protein
MKYADLKAAEIQDTIKKYFNYIFLFLIFHIQIPSLAAQFLSQEIAQRAAIEELLKTAEIVRFKEIGTGVTRPYRLYLEADGIELSGAWKNPDGMKYGFLEGWRFEIAAYEMDKLLGLNMIPPTIEREFQDKRGSLQFWIKSEMSDLERMEKEITIPIAFATRWKFRKYVMRAFDSLIGNEDRTQENIRYAENWRMILIDHSRSFRSSRKYTNRLMYGKNGVKEEQLFRKLPREFVERVKDLSFETIQNAVGDYLTKKEIDAVLKRKLLLLKEIDEMIREQGESEVLY